MRRCLAGARRRGAADRAKVVVGKTEDTGHVVNVGVCKRREDVSEGKVKVMGRRKKPTKVDLGNGAGADAIEDARGEGAEVAWAVVHGEVATGSNVC